MTYKNKGFTLLYAYCLFTLYHIHPNHVLFNWAKKENVSEFLN